MLKTTIKNEIMERMEELEGSYTCDCMYELYNTDYYIIGTYEAKQFLKENFDELLEALEDYQSEIGEQYPYITDPEKLATLTVLYVAETIWNELETVQDKWDSVLELEDIQEIKEELQSTRRL